MIKRLISIGFVFTLLANGLGSVIAASWCLTERCLPSAAEGQHKASHKSKANSGGHCPGAAKPSHHEGHQSAAPGKPAQTRPEQESAAQKRPGTHCGHCVSAPQSPAGNSFKASPGESRRDDSSGKQQACARSVLPGVASFPALAPSQGAPPAPVQRRHLLINVFLI